MNHVNFCAAYIKPLNASDSTESFAIGPNSLVDIVHAVQMFGETAMSISKIETGIEQFVDEKMVKVQTPVLEAALANLLKADPAILKAFTEGHDNFAAAFANRVADATYNAVFWIADGVAKQAKAGLAEKAEKLTEQLKASLKESTKPKLVIPQAAAKRDAPIDAEGKRPKKVDPQAAAVGKVSPAVQASIDKRKAALAAKKLRRESVGVPLRPVQTAAKGKDDTERCSKCGGYRRDHGRLAHKFVEPVPAKVSKRGGR